MIKLFLIALVVVSSTFADEHHPEFELIQGDMMVPKVTDKNANIQTGKWTGGVIPYVFTSGYTSAERKNDSKCNE